MASAAHQVLRNAQSLALSKPALVHLEQRLAKQLELNAVRVLEIDRISDAAVWAKVADAICLEALFGGLELVRLDRDGNVLDAADRFHPGLESETREVEEGQQVAVAEIEEKVGRAGVVAIFHDLDQREAEQVLVELDGLFDVAADHRQVVGAAHGRSRPRGPRPQIALPKVGPECFSFDA